MTVYGESPTVSDQLNGEHFEAIHRCVLGAAAEAVVDPAVRRKARRLLVDTIACVGSGRQSQPMRKFERSLADSDPGSFRFPGGVGLSSLAAAAVAASASAWDEACEGLPYAHGRPGLALIGALLPLAVLRGDSVDALLDALIAGYEVGARAGGWLRIRPGMHVDGNWPALGVAAGVGALLGLDPELRWQAVSAVACQLPASLYAPIRSGDDARNLYPAHSAWLGIMAVNGARAGIRAPHTALLDVARDHARPDGRPAPPESRALLLEAYFKPHAGVRHAHYGLEAAIQIREALHRETESIDAIHLSIYDEATRYADNRNPQAPITGQFSLSLGVAAGLRFGMMDPDLFRSAAFFDPELRRLEQLVTVHPLPEAGSTAKRSATLSVRAKGLSHEAQVTELAGDPVRPPNDSEFIDKFVRYSEGDVEPTRARAFAEALLQGGETSVACLWASLVSPD